MAAKIKKAQRLERARDMKYYPLALDVKNKLVVIVGGGKVALTKTQSLLKASAKIMIVSPELIQGLKKLNRSSKFKWIKREVQASDLKGAAIVIAATANEKVNKKVSNWANKKKILVNVVDQPALSSFISPAVFRKKQAIISVFTNGISPSLSRDIKNFLNDKWAEFFYFRGK
ncbi:MAG: bifunctional precorrin-2 dehydrogenase/sirohydrochlorin ferrochelatase [Candidatus Omnitrophota bacterium]